MKGFDAIIFDLDGVLLISEHLNVEAMCATMRLHGMPLTEQERMTIPGRSSMDAMPGFLRARGVPDGEHTALITENRARYDDLWDANVTLAPFATPVLNFFHDRKIPLAIGTTNRRSVVEKFIGRFGFDGMFSAIVTGKDVVRRKPDPEVYIIARQKLDVPADRVLVVGDTALDVEAAKGAGLACAVIPSEYFLLQDFSRADFRVSSLLDIMPIVTPGIL
ncbi:MAG TPA: HAD family phosphatase [Candidatus Paceibacterota bacterium]|nr:HAD family phosphatase [Candidatus Paceibacterota bacterium]